MVVVVVVMVVMLVVMVVVMMMFVVVVVVVMVVMLVMLVQWCCAAASITNLDCLAVTADLLSVPVGVPDLQPPVLVLLLPGPSLSVHDDLGDLLGLR